MFTVEATEADFEEIVINSDVPVVVDFYAPWCGPCKMLKPHLEKLAEKYQSDIKIVMINSDDNQDLTSEYGVRALPTLKFFSTKALEDSIVGTTNPTAIEEKILKLIGTK